MNNGKQDYFYWMLAVIGVLNFLILVFAKRDDQKHQVYGGEEAMKDNGGGDGMALEKETIKIEGDV